MCFCACFVNNLKFWSKTHRAPWISPFDRTQWDGSCTIRCISPWQYARCEFEPILVCQKFSFQFCFEILLQCHDWEEIKISFVTFPQLCLQAAKVTTKLSFSSFFFIFDLLVPEKEFHFLLYHLMGFLSSLDI